VTTTLDYALYLLVGIGVAAQIVACLGLALMRRAIDRLHYASAATGVGPAFIAAAVCTREGVVSAQGLTALLIAVVLAVAGGTLGLAVARIVRLRTHGTFEPSAAERERGS
jgi:multisubunit Na+/H+ antiporter MnhG subunit